LLHAVFFPASIVSGLLLNLQSFPTRRSSDLELRLKVKVIDDYQDILIDKMNGMHDTTEMLTDDIVLLDERTQPLVEDNTDGLAKELAEEVIKRIREAIE